MCLLIMTYSTHLHLKSMKRNSSIQLQMLLQYTVYQIGSKTWELASSTSGKKEN